MPTYRQCLATVGVVDKLEGDRMVGGLDKCLRGHVQWICILGSVWLLEALKYCSTCVLYGCCSISDVCVHTLIYVSTFLRFCRPRIAEPSFCNSYGVR